MRRDAERRQAAALEQIADAVEAQRLNHVASLTVGELMAALQPLMDGEADADDDYAELDTETHEDTNAGRTDYYTLLLEDGMRAHVDEEDKLTRGILGSGQTRNMTLINESGLYSLVLSSKLPAAKETPHHERHLPATRAQPRRPILGRSHRNHTPPTRNHQGGTMHTTT